MAKIAATQSRETTRRTPNSTSSNLRQETERLAYQFFVERGFQHGHDQEDWQRAEAIARGRRS